MANVFLHKKNLITLRSEYMDFKYQQRCFSKKNFKDHQKRKRGLFFEYFSVVIGIFFYFSFSTVILEYVIRVSPGISKFFDIALSHLDSVISNRKISEKWDFSDHNMIFFHVAQRLCLIKKDRLRQIQIPYVRIQRGLSRSEINQLCRESSKCCHKYPTFKL